MRPELILKLGQVAAVVHEPQHPAEDRREAVRQPVDRAEVQHTQPPVAQQPEVARMRIRMQEPHPRRTRKQETDHHDARPVPLSGRAAGDDPRQREAIQPFTDQHVVADPDHTRDTHIRVTGVAGGESLLGGSFPPVIQLLSHPVPQLGEQRLDVQARHEPAEKPGKTAQLAEIADQRPARTRVLDLDGHRRPSCQTARCTCPMDAAAAGSSPNSAKLARHCSPISPASTWCILSAGNGGADSCSLVNVARYGSAISGGSAASKTDSACPSFIAPPLSSPRTLNT